jgi:guanylate kinase
MAENPEISRRGLMLVLSSPSGAGKTAISRALLQSEPRLTLSVSATTRPMRTGEVDGVDYMFVDGAAFSRMIDDDAFLEHATVFDHKYGTPRGPVDAALAGGQDVLFDVDWQGAQELRERSRHDLVSVFILPPSMAELEQRLKGRGQDSDDVVAGRMERGPDEIGHWQEYDYIVVNQDLDDSVAKVRTILHAERLRRDRQLGLVEFVRDLTGRP